MELNLNRIVPNGTGNWQSRIRTCAILVMALATSLASAQTAGAKNAPEDPEMVRQRAQAQLRQDRLKSAESEGVEVNLGAIGKFRGARSNTIVGYGLVVGLTGTGDSSVQVAQTLLANVLGRWGTAIDISKFKPKNVALVSVTCELGPFVAPGTKADVLVQSIGDAKSLEGGVLLPTTLGTMLDNKEVFAVAAGSVATGGFSAGANGTGVQKNYPNVGRITNGADVQKSVATQFVFPGNNLLFDLQMPDFTNANRIVDKVIASLPGYSAKAVDGATIQITFPADVTPVAATSVIENLKVFANTPAKVVINARNGVIVAGGNIKLAPVMIVYGALRIKIETQNDVSQPEPLTQGQTTPVQNSIVTPDETSQIAVVPPNVTVTDLAQILQSLKLTAQDLISIFQELVRQGALKAQVEQV